MIGGSIVINLSSTVITYYQRTIVTIEALREQDIIVNIH